MKRKRKTQKKKARPKAQQLAMTTTGELFQPTRLHYKVSDPLQLERSFQHLQCIDSDPARQRWVWLYTAEARHIQLRKAPETGPIVIGEFLWKGEQEVVLNLRSVERALAAIEFFDHHVPRSLATITHVTIINRLFSVAEIMSLRSLHTLFEQRPLTVRDPDAMQDELLALKENSQNAQQKDAPLADYFDKLTQRPEPEMEKFPAHYYEDGIAPLRLTLLTRQTVAVQHWQGNTGYTLHHAIQDILH